ncbi:Endoplasmic reticulum mannosyl-oligosaccharide 1,2-alpha-mannosidase [Lamellibrachia satsuma]|nr:Endoplasmic reticulum mannosyl-oligosaccharide 1,2-alpha-mannosidase [Lamellibrachia satsuma]
MLFNIIRGNIKKKFCLLTVTVVFVYAIYLVSTLNRQAGRRSEVSPQQQSPRQPQLLLKHLQPQQQQQQLDDPQTRVDKESDAKFVEINVQPKYDDRPASDDVHSKYDNKNRGVKAPVRVNNAEEEINVKSGDTNTKSQVTEDDEDIHLRPYTGPYDGPQNAEQKAVIDTFRFAWSNYREHAWGKDELKPVTGHGTNWFGVGLTIVDSLDTLYIMGLKKEFAEAREWVAHHLVFNSTMEVSLFEIVIRELGGLLSAYYLSGDQVFLEKADQLANKLRPCMSEKSHIPCASVNLHNTESNYDQTNLASVGSLQLEFRALARATNNRTWEDTVDTLNTVLHKLQRVDGLLPIRISQNPPYTYQGSPDWLHTGKTKPQLKDDFIESVEGIKKHLVRHAKASDLTFVGKFSSMDMENFVPEMEHLTCYLPGLLALAYINGLGKEHLDLGEKIATTCYEMYRRSPTGLSPEVMAISLSAGGPNKGLDIALETAYSLLRPETVESFFYLYRATRDTKYKQWGWQIYEAIEKHARVEHGYSSIQNVQDVKALSYTDKMETFFLAETLKYLYLLFSDDPNLLPLDKFVFNTEAHPLPIYES